MATGMKLWLTATVAGMAIVAAWKLPPSPYPPREAVVKPAESMRSEAIDEEFRVTAEALRRVEWSDSLAPLVVSSAEEGIAFLYPSDAGLNADHVVRFDGMIRDEVAEHRGSDMVFGYVLQPYNHGQTPDMPNGARDRTELYVGMSGTRAYCIQVRVYHPNRAATTLARKISGQDRQARPESGALGTCRPYVQHGMPGPAIRDWMEEGAALFATETGESVADELGLGLGRRTVFGFSGYGYAINTLEADRCLAGYGDGCSDLLLQPARTNDALERNLKIVRASPVTAIGGSYFFRSVIHDVEYLFHDLEQEFGREAFGHFWTSDQDVEEAFAAAFGLDFGAWVVTWIDRNLGVDAPGPGLPRSSTTGGTLTIALLAGLAFMRTRKRRVG